MKVAHIAPGNPLYGHGYQLVLAPHVDVVEWESISLAGGYIILDNGAAEGEMVRFDELKKLAQQIHADEVVIPDVLGDVETTLTFYRMYANEIPYHQRFAVLQGRNALECIECLRYMMQIATPHTIGIPKHLGMKTRTEVVRQLHFLGVSTHIHMLGLSEHPATEVPTFKDVRGFDTGAAAAWAQHGQKISGSTERYSLDWDKPFDVHLWFQNIKYLEGLVYAHQS